MRDNGADGDEVADDGMYTASMEREGIQVTWMIQFQLPGDPPAASLARIEAVGRYRAGLDAWKEVRVGTIRANPTYQAR